jgi:hypothetical protein
MAQLDNVVSLNLFRSKQAERQNSQFSSQSDDQQRKKNHPHIITRIAPELDGLEMLYSNDNSEGQIYSLKILAWALYSDGSVEGLVPWLSNLIPCTSLQDPLNGHWEGYYIPLTGDVFSEPPEHKIAELHASQAYYDIDWNSPHDIVQEIPDTLGTHGAFIHAITHELRIAEISTWRLYHNGTISGMLVDEELVNRTPVLPRDKCLYEAQSHRDFRYFFQYRIANKIKNKDPEALEAMSLLLKH